MKGEQIMFEELKEMIMNYVDAEEDTITPEARFIEDLHFNSYDFMSFLGEAEDVFGITVDESDVLELHTVGDALKYIEKLKG